jgi:hypothetical protein
LLPAGLLLAAFTSICSAKLPDLGGSFLPGSYTEKYYDGFRLVQQAIQRRRYVAAERLFRKIDYVDGKTATAFNAAVTFIERNQSRAAVIAFYQSEFCGYSTSIDPDFAAVGATPLLKLGVEVWLDGRIGLSARFLERAKAKAPNLEEIDVVRGFMVFPAHRKRAFTLWRKALMTGEPPPPVALANIAAAELLVHYKP